MISVGIVGFSKSEQQIIACHILQVGDHRYRIENRKGSLFFWFYILLITKKSTILDSSGCFEMYLDIKITSEIEIESNKNLHSLIGLSLV